MLPANMHSCLGDMVAERNDLERVEEFADGGFIFLAADSYHHLDPGDDSNPGVRVSGKFILRRLLSQEIIDEDIGVENRLHSDHSARSAC